MSDISYTAEEILAEPLGKAVKAHQVTGVIIVVEYIDESDGKLRLAWRTDVPTWRVLGMASSVVDDALNGEMAWHDGDEKGD
jgi:hypothetical protein